MKIKKLISTPIILLLTICIFIIIFYTNIQTTLTFPDKIPNSKVIDTPNRAGAEAKNSNNTLANAYKTPIELHGRVEDQNGDPIPAASIKLTPVDTHFGDNSHSAMLLSSDSDGRFSVKGLHGISMGVSASKEGYLELSTVGSVSSGCLVEYAFGASSGRKYRNPKTPLVLTLHKIGQEDPMVFVEEKNRSLPADGTLRRIALDSENGVGSHQIEFIFKTDRVKLSDQEIYKKLFDWSFEARIPGGGFVWCDNDYKFEAPESGYKESIRVEYKANMPKNEWKRFAQGSFFVKFADGHHGRIRLNIDGFSDWSPLMLGSWLNLKPGSRNLATRHMSSTFASDERYRREWKW